MYRIIIPGDADNQARLEQQRRCGLLFDGGMATTETLTHQQAFNFKRWGMIVQRYTGSDKQGKGQWEEVDLSEEMARMINGSENAEPNEESEKTGETDPGKGSATGKEAKGGKGSENAKTT